MSFDDEFIDPEVYEEVYIPKNCAICMRKISSIAKEFAFYVDSSEVCLCKRCFRRTYADWVKKPPIQRPNGWWKKIVDPRLKGSGRIKRMFSAPIMRNGPCDNCGKEEFLYLIRFPTEKHTLFGINKYENRYFCKSCMTSFMEYLQS